MRGIRGTRLPEQSEEAFQRQIATALRHLAKRGVCWTHFPAGGHRNKSVGAKLKAEGMQPGWPDLQFVHLGHAYFLELKTSKGQVSTIQKALHAKLRANGALVDVARSFDQAIETLARWGLLDTAKASQVITQSVMRSTQPETTT